MKRFKKFLGVFLALAMVVGMVGMMPTVLTKAETVEGVTASITTPQLDTPVSKLTINFTGNIQHDVGAVGSADKKAVSYISGITRNNVSIGNMLETVDSIILEGVKSAFNSLEITIPETTFEAGDEVTVTFVTDKVFVSAVAFTTVTLVIPEQINPQDPPPANGVVSNVTFSNETNEITITVAGDEIIEGAPAYIYIGEAKDNGTVRTVKAYNVYKLKLDAEGKVSIDVSAFAKKGVILRVHTGEEKDANNNTLYKDITLSKSDAKLKVKLVDLAQNDATKRFEIINDKTKVEDFTKIEFRVEGGTWYSYTDENLKAAIAKSEQFGSTLYFRMLGNDVPGSEMFTSAEAKLKYPKLGKQPNVTVDYVKNLVKFPKLVEVIGVISGNGTSGTDIAEDWELLKAVEGKAGTISIDELYTGGGFNGFNFYVRTAAKDKKPSSAITGVKVVEKATTPTVGSITIEGEYNDNEAAALKKIKITNSTNTLLEYTITATATTKPADDARWTKLPVSTNPKALAATEKDNVIWIRVAGAKAVTRVGQEAPAIRVSETFSISFAEAGIKADKKVVKTDLSAAIEDAEELIDNTVENTVATNVEIGKYWALAGDITTYSNAIAAAKAVANNASATQAQVDAAISTLEEATTAFSTARSVGEKPAA